MNYQRIHNSIIQKAKDENRKKIKGGTYYERHHIIPKCMGGDNTKDNLVLLTAKEHYIIHLLLIEIYPNNEKLIYAFWMMGNKSTSKHKRNYIIPSFQYERLKINLSKVISKNNSGSNSHFYCNGYWKDKKGINNPNYGKKRSKEFMETYYDEKERLKRSETSKKYWTSKIKESFSDLIKQQYINNPNRIIEIKERISKDPPMKKALSKLNLSKAKIGKSKLSLYHNEVVFIYKCGLSAVEIAPYFCVSIMVVYRFLKNINIYKNTKLFI